MRRVLLKHVWTDRKDGKLHIGETIKLSNIIHEIDEIAVGGDFRIYVDDEWVYCSIEGFNKEQS